MYALPHARAYVSASCARAELPVFNTLMQATGARDGFGVHSAEYFAAAYELLVPQHAVFLLAEYEGEPLAAIVVAVVGSTACYLWGASSDRERSRMPNHALQWEGMRWARSRGATCYDFWGIPDDIGKLAAALHGGDGSGTPTEELPIDIEALPQGELWGVYRFKQGFGGSVVRTVGAWDMALDTIGYRVYQLGLSAREVAGAAQSLYRTFPRSSHDLVRNEAPAPLPASSVPEASVRLVDTAEEWRDVLAQLPEPHILQSWEWGEVKGQTGWHARRYALTGGAGMAAFQLLWRQPIAGVPLRMAYLPKGPLLEWANLDLLDSTLDAIEREARLLKCIYVKIDPDVRADTTTGHLLLHALERRGWRYSADQIQFKNTACSDLAVGEEALLAQMKQKWRYNVRLAEKRGVTVRPGSEIDFAAFYALYGETGARDGFLIRPYDYYAAAWRTFLAHRGSLATRPAVLCCSPSTLTILRRWPACSSSAMGVGPGTFTAPAASAAVATCPTICCNGKRCVGRLHKAVPSTTGGERRQTLTIPTTLCRASGSLSRALAPSSSRTLAPGTSPSRPPSIRCTRKPCPQSSIGCGVVASCRAWHGRFEGARLYCSVVPSGMRS